MKLLILGHTIPEPTTTAAGGRMIDLIKVFLEEGYDIHFATSALPNPRSYDLESIDISLDTIELNNSSFDDYIINLNPEVVVFDRFVIEEHYGWRIAKHCPDALRILDTEDLQFLRKARASHYKKYGSLADLDIYTETAKREIASIMRCDLSLIISEYEMRLLIDTFRVSESCLHYLPFMVSDFVHLDKLPSFEERQGFMTIGNFFHSPNVDSVLFLKRKIWPEIRKYMPSATMSIYGNYAPQQINELHNVNEGFLVKGWAPSIKKVMSKSRICLAPLNYGAGLKGKLLDAMIYGTPAITTSIGAEGMYGSYHNAGSVQDSVHNLVDSAVNLYVDKDNWEASQQRGVEILKSRFDYSAHSRHLKIRINNLKKNLINHRKENFLGQIFQHQTMQSNRYMSKWIEEKNKKNGI